MTTEYLVRKIETCPVCKGDKFFQNLGWAEVNRANQAWMEERGIVTFTEEARLDWERRIKEKWPYQKPPPEEEPCVECEGEGKIESWIPLREALAELGIWQPIDWAERAEAEGLDLPF